MDLEKMTNRKFSYCKGINGHYEIALSVRIGEIICRDREIKRSC